MSGHSAEIWNKVMVTGHRRQHFTGFEVEWVQPELDRVVRKLRVDHGMNMGISGLALGVDTWWATSVLAAGLGLWTFSPFPEQAERWGEADRDIRDHLIANSHRHWEGPPGFSVPKLHARNDRMLDEADAVVAVWDPATRSGGTFSAVKKAFARGLPVIHVNPVAKTTMRRRSL